MGARRRSSAPCATTSQLTLGPPLHGADLTAKVERLKALLDERNQVDAHAWLVQRAVQHQEEVDSCSSNDMNLVTRSSGCSLSWFKIRIYLKLQTCTGCSQSSLALGNR